MARDAMVDGACALRGRLSTTPPSERCQISRFVFTLPENVPSAQPSKSEDIVEKSLTAMRSPTAKPESEAECVRTSTDFLRGGKDGMVVCPEGPWWSEWLDACRPCASRTGSTGRSAFGLSSTES